jgi:translation initiation factor 5
LHAMADDGKPNIPEIVAKIEGRGNGIKTNISNCVEVSRIIKRHPAYLCKYLGVELGAQSKYEHDSGYAIVTGAQDPAILQDLFKKYIREFVTCGKCKGLQTKLSIDKKQKVVMKCKGCGEKTKVDQTHKVIKEILKFPPGTENEKKEKGVKKEGKKGRRQALKEDKGAPPPEDEEEEEEAEGGAEAKKPQQAEDEGEDAKAARRKKEKEEKKAKKAAKAAKAAAKEAKKAGKDRKEALGSPKEGTAATAAPAASDELRPMTPAEPGGETAAAAAEPEPEPAGAASDNVGEKLREAIDADGVAIAAGWFNGVAADMPLETALSTAFSTVFTPAAMMKEVKLCKRLFAKLCAKKDGQVVLFDLTVAFAKEHEPVMAKLGHHFKALYDEDLIEEELLIECYGKLDAESPEAKAAKAFVDWLSTADDDDDSSEEESDSD